MNTIILDGMVPLLIFVVSILSLVADSRDIVVWPCILAIVVK